MTAGARIFLADQRGLSQTDSFRSYHTFRFGTYRPDGREPLGRLVLLNDDTLRAGHRLSMTVEADTYVVLLPIEGGLGFSWANVADFLDAGQAQVLALEAGQSYTVSNPYETEFINFLTIWFQASQPLQPSAASTYAVDLSRPNRLSTFLQLPAESVSVQVGIYDGRHDDTYSLPPGHGTFVWVLNGVFEVQNRLLHERDGLALCPQTPTTLDFEALSNQALLLLIDVPV